MRALTWIDAHDTFSAAAILALLIFVCWADMRRVERNRVGTKERQLRRQLDEAWREVDRWKAVAGARRSAQ